MEEKVRCDECGFEDERDNMVFDAKRERWVCEDCRHKAEHRDWERI